MKSLHPIAAVCLAGGLLVSGLAFGLHRHAASSRPVLEARVSTSGLGAPPPTVAIRTESGKIATNSTSVAATSTAVAATSVAPKAKARVTRAARSAVAMAPAQGGLFVTRDESGTLVPASPQQTRALMGAQPEALSRSTDGLQQIQGPNGAVGVNLQGRFQDYATVTIGRDGKKYFGCVHDDGAKTDSIAAPKPLEEE